MSARYLRNHTPESDPIPWVRYVVCVGSVLIGLLFAADAYLPKADERPHRDIDRTVLRVRAPVQQAAFGPSSLVLATAPADSKPVTTR